MFINCRQQVCLSDKKGFVQDVLAALGAVLLLTYFFYRSFWAFLPLCPIGFVFFLERQGERKRQRERTYLLQFRECMQSVATAMRAGFSAENAFLESEEDMRTMFGEDSEMAKELRILRHGLETRQSLEQLLLRMGQRRKASQVTEFAEVFQIAKRGGGNITQILSSSADMIGQSIDLEEELQVFLASRRLQQKLMNGMPFLVVLYLDMTNPGYFEGLYHNPGGVLLMTGCLAVYCISYVWAERMLRVSAV